MFADNIEITIKAGKGGDGRSSFLHEKYRAMGGPDGGDGGKGGDVVFEVDHNLNTLAYFRGHKRISATSGESGGGNKSHGKSAEDVVIKVPVGTMVFESERKLADLTEDGQRSVIARGGRGGFGNAHFVSSRRQSPRAAELGEAGQELSLRLELKLVADVGLIGLPNAGKSTLLSVISNARPEIADYAFTTLIPNLGVASVDDYSFVVADIPGLIEGASAGKGLGDEFLRHIERTAVLIHLIDSGRADIAGDYQTIMTELTAYGHGLAEKPQIITVTKAEGSNLADVKKLIQKLKKLSKFPVFAISAVAHQGLNELLRAAAVEVKQARQIQDNTTDEPFVYDLSNVETPQAAWRYEHEDDVWIISGQKIEGFARRTDFEVADGLDRFRDILGKLGISKKLERIGLEGGDSVEVAGKRFTW